MLVMWREGEEEEERHTGIRVVEPDTVKRPALPGLFSHTADCPCTVTVVIRQVLCHLCFQSKLRNTDRLAHNMEKEREKRTR